MVGSESCYFMLPFRGQFCLQGFIPELADSTQIVNILKWSSLGSMACTPPNPRKFFPQTLSVPSLGSDPHVLLNAPCTFPQAGPLLLSHAHCCVTDSYAPLKAQFEHRLFLETFSAHSTSGSTAYPAVAPELNSLPQVFLVLP